MPTDGMTRKEAITLLGLKDMELTPSVISSSFRKKALQAHPDRYPKRIDVAHELFIKLTSARDLLLGDEPGEPLPMEFNWTRSFALRGCVCSECFTIRVSGGPERGLEEGELGIVKDWEDFDDEIEGTGTASDWEDETFEEEQRRLKAIKAMLSKSPSSTASSLSSKSPSPGGSRNEMIPMRLPMLCPDEDLAKAIRERPRDEKSREKLMKLVKELLKRPKYQSNPAVALDDAGNTALHYAAFSGRVEIIKLLLETFSAKVLLPVTNDKGRTAGDVVLNSEVLGVLLDYKRMLGDEGIDIMVRSRTGNPAGIPISAGASALPSRMGSMRL